MIRPRLRRLTRQEVFCGDSDELLEVIPEEANDSVVTDPPAGIGFMGKSWDHNRGGRDLWIAWMTGIAAKCLRVTKPGGHALVWALPRTAHWTTTAWENAGWEVRDVVHHLFGTGFPKSLDVSKAIDANVLFGGSNSRRVRPGNGRTRDSTRNNGIMGEAEASKVTRDEPATPEGLQWQGWGTALKPACENWILLRKPMKRSVAENVLRHGTGGINIDGCRVTAQRPDITLPRWAKGLSLCGLCAERVAQSRRLETQETGGSTVTNPVEPILSVRDGSMSEATSRTDTGCSDGTSADDTPGSSSIGASGKTSMDQSPRDTSFTTSMAINSITRLKICNACGAAITPRSTPFTRHALSGSQPTQQGQENIAPSARWPANVCHDGSDEVTSMFPVGRSAYPGRPDLAANYNGAGVLNDDRVIDFGTTGAGLSYADSGSAARFFYIAKPSQRERNMGLNGEKNDHVAVKSIALMRYLCKLITPRGGRILDPFMGTGTTGVAAALEGFNFTGIELDPHYCKIAEQRIQAVKPRVGLRRPKLNPVRPVIIRRRIKPPHADQPGSD